MFKTLKHYIFNGNTLKSARDIIQNKRISIKIISDFSLIILDVIKL